MASASLIFFFLQYLCGRVGRKKEISDAEALPE
jgi:hypothetical protein